MWTRLAPLILSPLILETRSKTMYCSPRVHVMGLCDSVDSLALVPVLGAYVTCTCTCTCTRLIHLHLYLFSNLFNVCICNRLAPLILSPLTLACLAPLALLDYLALYCDCVASTTAPMAIDRRDPCTFSRNLFNVCQIIR